MRTRLAFILYIQMTFLRTFQSPELLLFYCQISLAQREFDVIAGYVAADRSHASFPGLPIAAGVERLSQG